MYEPVQPLRLYEQIVKQVEDRILTGELKEGDRLPSERELTAQFGVSRTAVREAIMSLNAKGLVEIQPGRGTFISDGTSDSMKHSIGMLMKIKGDIGSNALVEVREIFEPEIAALAAERVTDENIQVMRQAVRSMDEAMDDMRTFIESDLDFHLGLAESSQNVLIPFLIDTIVDLLRDQRVRIFMVEGGPSRGQYHHKRILDAVERRDPKAAREAMCEHLVQVRQDVKAAE